MIKDAVSNAIRESYADLDETREYARLDSFPSSLADRAYSACRQQRWPTTSTGHQRPSTNTRAARQIRYERTVCLWFAKITLQSRSTITQEILSSNQNEPRVHETTRTRKRVIIRLHSWILRKGILASLERQYLGGTSLSADMRLRVYSIVSHYSPIAEACRLGDFATAYSLFQSGQASVFDMVEELDETLLDYTWRRLKASMQFRSYKTSTEPRVRDGLLQIFKFLATHGLDPGEPARQVCFECQMSRLQQIFECAVYGPDFLTPYLVEVIRVIIANSRQNPFEAQSRYQGPLIKLACEMRHELAACIRSQEQWCLKGCFEEDHSFPDYTLTIEPGYVDGPFSAFRVHSLVGDPDAIYLRAMLHFKVTSCDLPSICLHSLANSRELTENIGGCWDHAVKARVIACLEAGMDWIDEVSLETVANDWATLVEWFASQDSLHILKAAWLELGNDLRSFYANFEGEIVCAIVRDLDALRPARKWRLAKVWDRRQEIYDLSSSIFLDEAYRKFFPDDEEKIEKIGYGFDAVTFSRRKWGYLEDDFESLPLVNGLTEDFWE